MVRFAFSTVILFAFTSFGNAQESIAERLTRLEANNVALIKQFGERFDKLESKVDDLAAMLMANEARRSAESVPTEKLTAPKAWAAPVAASAWSSQSSASYSSGMMTSARRPVFSGSLFGRMRAGGCASGR